MNSIINLDHITHFTFHSDINTFCFYTISGQKITVNKKDILKGVNFVYSYSREGQSAYKPFYAGHQLFNEILKLINN